MADSEKAKRRAAIEAAFDDAIFTARPRAEGTEEARQIAELAAQRIDELFPPGWNLQKEGKNGKR
jgi:hypothetical protein